MNKLITELVKRGIPVTIRLDRDGEVFYDLNAGTKSGMYAYEVTDQYLEIRGRYQERDMVHCLEDLAYLFASRYRAKEFGDQKWLDVAVEQGVMTRKVTEVVTYS